MPSKTPPETAAQTPLSREQLNQLIIDNAPVGMALQDITGRWVRVNSALCDMLGYEQNELLTMNFQSLSHPEEIGRDGESLEKIKAAEISQLFINKRYLHKNGIYIQTRVYINAIAGGSGDAQYLSLQIVDIAEQVRLRDELVDVKVQLQGLVQHAPLVITLKNMDGNYVLINRFGEEKTGVSANQLIGKTAHEIMAPEIAQSIVNRDAQVIQSGEPVSEETVEDDEVFLHTSFLIKDKRGKPAYVGNFAVDVTEQKKAATALADVEAHMKSFIDNAPSAFSMKDIAGRYLIANRSFQELRGLSEEEIVGKSTRDIFPEKEADIINACEQEIVKSGKTIRQERDFQKEDDKRIVSSLVFPVRDSEGIITAVATMSEDVTESKRIKEALKRSEELNRIAIDSAPIGMLIIDSDGKIVLVNLAMTKLFGYQEDELVGQPVECLVPARYRVHHDRHRDSFFSKPMARSMGAGRDLYGLRKDGSEFPVEVGLNPIQTAEGTRVISSIVDITGRKRVEQQMRIMLDAAPNGMLMIDKTGKIMMLNLAMKSLFGYEEHELIGQSVDCLVPERYRGHHAGHRSSFFSEPKVRSMGVGRDLYGLKKDGSEFPVEIGLNPIETADGVRVISSIVDITERKRAEREVRLMFGAAPNAMIMVDRAGKMVMVNQAMINLFGYEEIELVGQPIDKLIPERYRGQHKDYRSSFFSGPKARAMGAGRDLYGLKKDGSEFPVEIGLNPIETAAGMRVISSIVDITERKEAQTKLQKYAEDLLYSNRELEQFAYVASHDLQEPLRMVASFTELLGKRYQDKLDQQANEYIGFAIDGAKRMQGLINDLLQYSRIGSEKKEFAPVDCQDVIVRVKENLLVAIEENKVDLSSCNLPVVLADGLQITLLLQNLIGNAIKYSDPGRSNQVYVSAERREDDWLFCVKDNGIGISEAFYERIFIIFQRLHGKSEYGGSGIGLAICRKIVERHGGKIWVESKQGQGSKFYFTLPVMQ